MSTASKITVADILAAAQIDYQRHDLEAARLKFEEIIYNLDPSCKEAYVGLIKLLLNYTYSEGIATQATIEKLRDRYREHRKMDGGSELVETPSLKKPPLI